MEYKQMIMSIKRSCQVTIKCNKRIMEREFEDYDGRYYDEEREQYTILETENHQAEIIIDSINQMLKDKKIK